MWKNHSRQTESPPPSLPPSLSLNFLSHKLSPGVRQNSTFQEGASTQLRTSALCQPTVSVNLKTVRRKHTNLTPSDAGKWIKYTRWRHINVHDLVNTRHLWGLLNNFWFGREQYFTKPIISFEWRAFRSRVRPLERGSNTIHYRASLKEHIKLLSLPITPVMCT